MHDERMMDACRSLDAGEPVQHVRSCTSRKALLSSMHFQLIQLLTGVSMSRLTSRRVSPSHDLYRVALRCVVSVAFIIAPSLTAQTSLPATSAPTTGAQPTIAPANWNGGWIGVVTTASVTPAGQGSHDWVFAFVFGTQRAV